MDAVEQHELAQTRPRYLDQHPAVVYLAGLSEASRRTMFQALQTIARILSDGQLDMFSLNWGALRHEHTAAVRAQLVARYKPATVNRMLSALRQVLYHAWRLGQISEEDYQQARAVENVHQEKKSSSE
jgi:adenylylsulfate kinase-like enzyme